MTFRIPFFSGFLTSAVVFYELALRGPFVPPTSYYGFPAGLCLPSTSLLTLLQISSMNYDSQFSPLAYTSLLRGTFIFLFTIPGRVVLSPQCLRSTRGHIPITFPLNLSFLVACFGEWQHLLYFCLHQKRENYVSSPKSPATLNWPQYSVISYS